MESAGFTIDAAIDPALDPAIDHDVRAFLAALNAGGTALETLPPRDARQALADAQSSVDVDLSGVDHTARIITIDGYSIKLDIVRPSGVEGLLPVFMFMHGGGWVLGDFPTHERMVRDLVVLSGCTAVFVNYTRSPEAVYPQAAEEVYAATRWVVANGSDIGVDGNRIAVVGNSAGGNLATVTALMAKEKGGPEIRLQVLFWPVTDADFDNESYRLFGDARFLTRSLMMWMFDQYIPHTELRHEHHAAPLRATIEQLRGLPPTLILVAENDILRDEGEAYGRRLAEAGVSVTTVRYNGMIHDFGLLNDLATLPATRSLFLQAAGELRKYLVSDSAPAAATSH